MDEVRTENTEELETQEKSFEDMLRDERTPEQIAAYEAEEEERAKKAKIAAVWDKITTGILIALMASPFCILAYIFIWFITA